MKTRRKTHQVTNTQPPADDFQQECCSWAVRLKELYDEAKDRHHGASLTIYSEVCQMLNYLEGLEDLPQKFDLFHECDKLASRLRRA